MRKLEHVLTCAAALLCLAGTGSAGEKAAGKSASAKPVQAGASKTDEAGLKWLSFSEGLQVAAKTHKPMLVDVYTNWCGWCKRMEATTYKDEKVIQDLNENFVIVKLNAESDRAVHYKDASTEREVAQDQWSVSGYPTTVFLKWDGEVISPLPGYVPADNFHPILRYISSGAYETMKFSEYLKKNS
jgi:thioredoxin-related protein